MTEVSVIYEDNHLLVLNKPAGMLVQGDITGDQPLVEWGKGYIKKKYNKPGEVFLGVVHRLDRPVSGLVLMARTSKALSRMNEQFKSRQVEKEYWAIVENRPVHAGGKLSHWLSKDEKKNKVTAYDAAAPGRQFSELTYALIGEANGFYLISVRPVTGRSHQIRVQLASMDCPIAGDVKYGYPNAHPDASISLHSRSLSFTHPTRDEKLTLYASLPDRGMWKYFINFEDKN